MGERGRRPNKGAFYGARPHIACPGFRNFWSLMQGLLPLQKWEAGASPSRSHAIHARLEGPAPGPNPAIRVFRAFPPSSACSGDNVTATLSRLTGRPGHIVRVLCSPPVAMAQRQREATSSIPAHGDRIHNKNQMKTRDLGALYTARQPQLIQGVASTEARWFSFSEISNLISFARNMTYPESTTATCSPVI